MADTRFLLKKGNTWYLNLTIPKRVKSSALAGKKIRISLQTADLKVAQRWRDRHVIELMNAENELYLLETLARKIIEADRRLEDKLEELLPHYKLRGVKEKQSITLDRLITLFLEHLRERKGLKINSLDKYRSSLKLFSFILGSEVQVIAVKHEDIQRFTELALRLPVGWSYAAAEGKTYLDIVTQTPRSGSKRLMARNSVRYTLLVAKSMFEWGNENNLLPRAFKMPFKRKLNIYVESDEQKHKRAPNIAEADRLCQLPMPQTVQVSETAWQCLPLIARYSGMRLAEIAQLHREDIVTEEGFLCIKVCRNVKTLSSQRMIPVAEKLRPLLESLMEEIKTGRLFPLCGDMSTVGVMKYGHAFAKLWDRRAKQVASDLSFHCWRVYANFQMTKAGIDLLDRERLLGHANERTNASYLPADLERLKKAVDSIT